MLTLMFFGFFSFFCVRIWSRLQVNFLVLRMSLCTFDFFVFSVLMLYFCTSVFFIVVNLLEGGVDFLEGGVDPSWLAEG